MVVTWSVSAAVPGRDIFQTASQYIEAFFIITMGLNFCCTGAQIFYLIFFPLLTSTPPSWYCCQNLGHSSTCRCGISQFVSSHCRYYREWSHLHHQCPRSVNCLFIWLEWSIHSAGFGNTSCREYYLAAVGMNNSLFLLGRHILPHRAADPLSPADIKLFERNNE